MSKQESLKFAEKNVNVDSTFRIKRRRLLANTTEAAEFTGLSAFELRRGYRAGIYPAIAIGGGSQKRLRWNLDILAEAIERQMFEEDNEM